MRPKQWSLPRLSSTPHIANAHFLLSINSLVASTCHSVSAYWPITRRPNLGFVCALAHHDITSIHYILFLLQRHPFAGSFYPKCHLGVLTDVWLGRAAVNFGRMSREARWRRICATVYAGRGNEDDSETGSWKLETIISMHRPRVASKLAGTVGAYWRRRWEPVVNCSILRTIPESHSFPLHHSTTCMSVQSQLDYSNYGNYTRSSVFTNVS